MILRINVLLIPIQGGELMDPITHGVIGLALSTFSGTAPSMSNPISIGCTVGAMMPDVDVVVKLFKNDMVYIKEHRGRTHSVPYLFLMSAVVTFGLYWMFPQMNILQILLWTFIGGLSHTGFDMLNSYGAQLLKKKRKLSILTLYDPIISLLALYLIFATGKTFENFFIVAALFFLYLGLRIWVKAHSTKQILKKYHGHHMVSGVSVLPALKAFHKWDYILKTDTHNIVGQYNMLSRKFNTIAEYEKPRAGVDVAFKRTNLGKYFTEMTNDLHVEIEHANEGVVLRAKDLRYYYKNEFLHQATIYIDKNGRIHESHFHPYKKDNKVRVQEY